MSELKLGNGKSIQNIVYNGDPIKWYYGDELLWPNEKKMDWELNENEDDQFKFGMWSPVFEKFVTITIKSDDVLHTNVTYVKSSADGLSWSDDATIADYVSGINTRTIGGYDIWLAGTVRYYGSTNLTTWSNMNAVTTNSDGLGETSQLGRSYYSVIYYTDSNDETNLVGPYFMTALYSIRGKTVIQGPTSDLHICTTTTSENSDFHVVVTDNMGNNTELAYITTDLYPAAASLYGSIVYSELEDLYIITYHDNDPSLSFYATGSTLSNLTITTYNNETIPTTYIKKFNRFFAWEDVDGVNFNILSSIDGTSWGVVKTLPWGNSTVINDMIWSDTLNKLLINLNNSIYIGTL